MPIKLANTKKLKNPKYSTKKPEVDPINLPGSTARKKSNAYCVAVKDLFVKEDK